jgi:hypothetical protein
MRQPPPYFPQSQLSPPDDKRYKKLKLFAGAAILGLMLILVGVGFGLYYFLRWLF